MTAHDDDLASFRAALAKGDGRHAAHHLAGLVAEGRTPVTEAALAAFVAAFDVPLELVSLGKTPYAGLVALRAILLARASRGIEALALMLQASAVMPETNLLAWLADHAKDETFVRGLDLEALAEVAIVATAVPAAAAHAASLLDEVRRRREPHAAFTLIVARLKRVSGDVEGAIAMVDGEHRRAPSYASAIARGVAYKVKGDERASMAGFREALVFAPEDLPARLEIGDLALAGDDRVAAAQAYAEVVARDPKHEWAWPSQLYLLARDGDEAARSELNTLASGGNIRARTLFGWMEPFVVNLAPPSSSCVNAIRAALEKGQGLLSMASSSLEPPSAVASVRAALVATGRTDVFSITFAAIPTPDPRLPREPVAWQLWTYDGDVATAGIGAPRRDIAVAVAGLANTPYDAAAWRAASRRIAQGLLEADVVEVLGTMVHLPPAPQSYAPWDWAFRVQVAAAFVACRIGGGAWEGSTRARATHALLNGPVDWTTTAAIIALSELARETPEIANAVTQLLASLLGAPESPVHYGCVYRPLVYALLRVPDLAHSLQTTLLDLRRSIEADEG